MSAKRSRRSTTSARVRTPRARARDAEKAPAPARNNSQGTARGASRPRRQENARVEEFAKLLLDERKRLRAELSEMEEHQVKTEEKPVADVAGYDDDLVDVATETFEREKELALETSVQGMLQMVEEALRKVHEGTYGICDGCGKPIDGNRLRAIPYARLCIKCKEREERYRTAVR